MKPFFEIKYLELIWYDKNTLTKVTESLNSLYIQYDEDKAQYECETTIYPNAQGAERGQLAFRFLNKKESKPYIEMANGNAKYLTPIKDSDTGLTWWIVADEWDSKNKIWRSIAPNIAGTVRFRLQNKTCELSIAGGDFTREQLETYLRSFKNDLWELILDENSAVQADVKASNGMGINEKVIDCINNLVSHAEKVLSTPKVELREIQALKPRKAVKPVNRTFMELVTKTNQRFLTSRATEPSYNVSENRYVLFALERCYRIIKQIVILANNKVERYQDTVVKLQSQHDGFSDSVIVNRDLVVADLHKLKEQSQLSYWKEKLNEKIKNNDISFQENGCFEDFYIRIDGKTKDQYSGEHDGFFILIWNGYSKQWEKLNGKTTILTLRQNYSKFVNVFESGMDLKITCNKKLIENQNSNLYVLNSVKSVELIGANSILAARKAFDKERAEGIKLNKQSWQKQLTKQDLDEQDKEKQALRNRILFYGNNQALSEYVYKKVGPKLRQLDLVIKGFKKLQIKPAANFPNSMTFVQNPHYQGVHNGYKILRDVTNLADEELLVSLEEIDAIGLVNMPMLYERWCFLQLVKVLKDPFRFTPQNNWKYHLIDAIKTNKTDIAISLSNDDAKRFITLTYEKTLDHGKRPDFVLDLTWFSKEDTNNTQSNHKRFVMDAKFYNKVTFDRFGGLFGVIENLYHGKNYSENGQNPVFIIHPCPNALPVRVTSQPWGKYSHLGEINIGNEIGKYPNHSYGGIFLNPIDREIYNDELQRLLGMFLQYKLEDSNPQIQANDLTTAVPICIRCGSTRIEQVQKTSGYTNSLGDRVTRTPRSVWCKCTECEQYQIFNHCRSKNTRLIKNGLYWSYHSARAIEYFNMKCPSCGEWGAW